MVEKTLLPEKHIVRNLPIIGSSAVPSDAKLEIYPASSPQCRDLLTIIIAEESGATIDASIQTRKMRRATCIQNSGDIRQDSRLVIKLCIRLTYGPVLFNIAKICLKGRKDTAFHEQVSIDDPSHRSGID